MAKAENDEGSAGTPRWSVDIKRVRFATSPVVLGWGKSNVLKFDWSAFDLPQDLEPVIRCVACGTRLRSHAERQADGRFIVDVLPRCASCQEDLDVIDASKKLEQRKGPRRPKQRRRHLRLVKK